MQEGVSTLQQKQQLDAAAACCRLPRCVESHFCAWSLLYVSVPAARSLATRSVLSVVRLLALISLGVYEPLAPLTILARVQ